MIEKSQINQTPPLLATKLGTISVSKIASLFFGIGILLVLIEALFFEYFSGLAHSSFTTRSVIGFHLFPSELWFIFLGNTLIFVFQSNKYFAVRKDVVKSSGPIIVVLGVYSLWFVYGFLSGNSWALQEFREMVFTALSLPPILYFASFVRVGRIFSRIILSWLVIILIASIFSLHNSVLMIAIFIVAYYALKMLLKNSWWAAVGLLLASIPFVIKFSKPMVVLFVFSLMASFILAGYLNPRSPNWFLSKFKMRILIIFILLVSMFLMTIFIINIIYDGVIEEIIRWYFLKERVTSTGEVYYGNWTGGRLAIWREAIDSWLHKPLFGYGLGAEVETYSKGWIVKVQYHNYVIQALHNTGLVGLTLILSSWFVWLWNSAKKVYLVQNVNEKIVYGGMLIYMCSVFFYGLYGHSLSYPPSSQFFWLCMAFLSALQKPLEVKKSV